MARFFPEKAMCNLSAYKGNPVHKILQDQFFFVAGKQGRRDKGEVQAPSNIMRNMEVVNPKTFQLKHTRPGTLSLCLSVNNDYDEIKLNPDYRNVEFLVTTGPGPCPQLDNENIVFGTVLEDFLPQPLHHPLAIRASKPIFNQSRAASLF